MGIAVTRNICNALARGEVICVLDSDDVCQKDRLKATWKYFQRHKGVDLVYGSYQYMDLFGKPFQEEKSRPFVFEDWKQNNHICHVTVAYRKKAIREITYREDMTVLDDLFLYFDFLKAGKRLENIDDTLAFHRIRPSSVSHSKEELIESKRKQFKEEADAYSRTLGS
jgi:cellulose synthase/poly-beta-1,6-N-acetylglucosamine synthase-like glycosyltransferase